MARCIQRALTRLGLLLTVGLAAEPATPTPKPVDPPKEEVTVMAPFKVKADPSINFGVSLRVLFNESKTRIARVFVSEVRENSDAERERIQVGDEVIKINGRPVDGMDARLDRDSDLGKLLLNQPVGTEIKLEIVTRATRNVRLKAYSPL